MRTTRRNLYERLEESADNPIFLLIATALFLALFGIALKVVFNNVEPYLALTGSSQIKPSGYPIIGWLFDVINLCYVAAGAMTTWALIQGSQVSWILIQLDRKAQRTAIKESRREASTIDANSGDDARIRRMRRKAIRVPFFFIAASGWIALAAFVAEFVINARYFPLIKSWNAFLAGLTIGNLSAINSDNLISLLWNLFSTEFSVVALIIVGQWIWSHRNG